MKIGHATVQNQISGTPEMVTGMHTMLSQAGVNDDNIGTDEFQATDYELLIAAQRPPSTNHC